jgi:uncharacterized protein YbjT (DUF2867 family)
MANEKEIIAVTGPTGNIGRLVVEGLIAKGYQPRAVVLKQKHNEAWDKAGVEQVVADGADVAALTQAFAGASRIFSLSPLVENMVEIGTAHIAAAKEAGVKHIVRSSALGAGIDSQITMGRWHGAVEKAIEDSGVDFTFVQPASFFQNYLGYADTIKNQSAFYIPQGDAKVSLIDARDIAAVAVAALTEPRHAGKKYAVTGGESLSNNDIANILSNVLGREIKYVDVPEDAARQQMLDARMPLWMVEMVMELNGISKAGYVAEVLPIVEQITGRPPRTFRAFAEENRQIFLSE